KEPGELEHIAIMASSATWTWLTGNVLPNTEAHSTFRRASHTVALGKLIAGRTVRGLPPCPWSAATRRRAPGAPIALAGGRRTSPKSPFRTRFPAPCRPPAGGPCPRRSGYRLDVSQDPCLSVCAPAARAVLGTCRTWLGSGGRSASTAGRRRCTP